MFYRQVQPQTKDTPCTVPPSRTKLPTTNQKSLRNGSRNMTKSQMWRPGPQTPQIGSLEQARSMEAQPCHPQDPKNPLPTPWCQIPHNTPGSPVPMSWWVRAAMQLQHEGDTHNIRWLVLICVWLVHKISQSCTSNVSASDMSPSLEIQIQGLDPQVVKSYLPGGNSCTCMWCVFKFFLSIETQASNCLDSNHCSLFHTLHSIVASLPESAESEHTQMKLEYSQGNNGLLSCYQRLIWVILLAGRVAFSRRLENVITTAWLFRLDIGKHKSKITLNGSHI